MKRILPLIILLIVPFIASAAKPEGSDKVTVLSYNVRMGNAEDGTNSWQYRYPASILMILDQKPDVIGLQEAFFYQEYVITENCRDYKAVSVGRDDGKKKGERMSILYNKKTMSLLKWGTFWLSDTPDKPSKGWDAACFRTATWAILKSKKTGDQFFFVNTHLDHKGTEARKNGLNLIVARINSMNKNHLPVILTGDFNAEPESAELQALDGIMKNARRFAAESDSKGTYNGWGKENKIIDYIYYSGISACLEFETVCKPYDNRKFISDHYPIRAEFIF